jgi:hypothetical protein
MQSLSSVHDDTKRVAHRPRSQVAAGPHSASFAQRNHGGLTHPTPTTHTAQRAHDPSVHSV